MVRSALPYHSSHEATRVYHTSNGCPAGPLISDEMRKTGKHYIDREGNVHTEGPLRLCVHCAKR
jgi:hypothetical protein